MSQFMLNMDAVNKEAEKMNSASSGPGYFSRKDISPNSEVDIRILPPLKSLNGLFYLKRITIWINKKPYVSPRTFNEQCPIMDMVDEINKGNDEDLKALVKASTFNVSEDYLLPILLLEAKYENNQLQDCIVQDDTPKVFDCTWGLIKKFNNVVTNRHYQNGTPLGLLDMSKGHNITVSKEVKSDRTNYDAMVWPTPTEMPESYYENVPDVVELTRKRMYTKETLEGVGANYFLGEPMPELIKEDGSSKEEKPKGKSIMKASTGSAQAMSSTKVEKTKEAPAKKSGGSLLERLKNG